MNDNTLLDCIKKPDEFASILKNWLESYVRSIGQKDTEWLTLELSKVFPSLDNKDAVAIASDIVDYVDSIMAAKADLQKAQDQGMSRKEWLYRKLKDSAKDFSETEFGNLVGSFGNGILKEFQDAVNSFDGADEKGKTEIYTRHVVMEPDVLPPPQGWNDANIKDRVFDTSTLLNMLTVLGLSKLSPSVLETGSVIATSPMAKEISEALLKGDTGGAVKALSGALKEAYDKKILDLDVFFPILKDKLPPYILQDDPSIVRVTTPILVSLADRTVGYIILASKIVSGEIKVEDALDAAVDQATSAAGGIAETVCAKYGSQFGEHVGTWVGAYLVPIVGPAAPAICGKIGAFVGGLLGEKVAKPVKDGLCWLGGKAKDIGRTVVDGVCSAGRAVYNGVKNVASKAVSGIKSAGRSIINFVSDLF